MSDTTDAPSAEIAPRTVEGWLTEKTGVQIIEVEGRRMISVPPDLANVANVLVPVSQITQVDENFSPTPRIVKLEVGVDTYKQGSKKIGSQWTDMQALNKQGLMKLAELAGIEFLSPSFDFMGGKGIAVTAYGRKRGADGLWRSHHGTKVVWFDRLEKKIRREAVSAAAKYNKPTPTEVELEERVDNEMDNVAAKVETKAMNRVIRSFLSVKSAYAPEELNKPFFIVAYSFTPNYADPNVRNLIAMEHGQSMESLYDQSDTGPMDMLPRGMAPSAPAGSVDLGPDDDDDDVIAVEGVEVRESTGEVLTPAVSDVTPPVPEPAVEPEGFEDDSDLPFAPAAAAVVHPKPEKPDSNTDSKMTSGPFEGQRLSQIVQSRDGQKYLAGLTLRMRSEYKQTVAKEWLAWGTGEYIDDEGLAALQSQ
jgi:hypothetical protein